MTEEKAAEVKSVLQKLSENTLTVKIYSSENERLVEPFNGVYDGLGGGWDYQIPRSISVKI